MELERAKAINRDLCTLYMSSIGLGVKFPDVSRYTLREMIEATEIMDGYKELLENGNTRITCVCDMRMVAAIYVWEHSQPERGDDLEPIIQGRGKSLLLVEEARACRVCGCTEEAACEDKDGEPCHSVEADLCSACVGKENKLGKEYRP